MSDAEAGQKQFALLLPRLGELLQGHVGDDMLIRLVLPSVREQRADPPQDLLVGGHLSERRCTGSHFIHLPFLGADAADRQKETRAILPLKLPLVDEYGCRTLTRSGP